MSTVVKFVLCLIVIVSMVSFIGCAKKSEPTPPSTPVAAPKPTAAAPAAPVEPAAKTPETPAPAVPNKPSAGKLTPSALAAVSLDYVKADAAKMNVDQLKVKATDYKDAIIAKKDELTKETAKLKEIPVTQLLSTDAKTLQTNIANLTKTVTDLTERFQVYNNKLKELGGTPVELTQ